MDAVLLYRCPVFYRTFDIRNVFVLVGYDGSVLLSLFSCLETAARNPLILFKYSCIGNNRARSEERHAKPPLLIRTGGPRRKQPKYNFKAFDQA